MGKWVLVRLKSMNKANPIASLKSSLLNKEAITFKDIFTKADQRALDALRVKLEPLFELKDFNLYVVGGILRD